MSRKKKAHLRARRSAAAGNSRSLTVGARGQAKHPLSRRLACERLEDRRLLAVVTVDVLDDSVDPADGRTSLREAIFATNGLPGADEIRFDPALFGGGTRRIRLKHGELAITDSVLIQGPVDRPLVVDASGNDVTPSVDDGNGSRIFKVTDGNANEASIVTLVGLLLHSGDVADNGGGIYNEEQLTLIDCEVSYCSALGHGGAIYSAVGIASAQLQLVRSNCTSNSAGMGGGAIYTIGSELILEESLIAGNSSITSGGGIHLQNASLRMTGGGIVSNTASGDGAPLGGGIFIQNRHGLAPYRVLIERGSINGNSVSSTNGAMGRGGGLYCAGDSRLGLSPVEIRSTRIGSNRADGQGGGMFIINYSSAISDSRFEFNFAINSSSSSSYQVAGGGAYFAGPVTIYGSTFALNGATGHGGGLYFPFTSDLGEVKIAASEVIGNFANQGHGGGISFDTLSNARLSIDDSTIAHNSAGASGGALFAEARVDIANSVVAFNSAAYDGGGIRSSNVLNVSHCVVHANTTRTNAGGGIAVNGGLGELRLTNSSVTSNFAFKGGGIFCSSATRTVYIEGSTVSDNYALSGGGVTAFGSLLGFTLFNTTISRNTGGGLLGGRFTLRHCTVTANTGWASGISGEGTTLDHCIVFDNRDDNGNPVDLRGSVTARFSIIGTAQGTMFTEAPVGSPDANGNLIGGPVHGVIDPKLGPLANNGGPTLTHALLPGSPAIDAGDGALAPGVGGVPEFDQRGAPFTRVSGTRIDIGAFEFQAAGGALAADFTFDGRTDGSDFLVWQRNVGRTSGATFRHGDATADGDVDGNDLAVWRARYGAVSGQLSAVSQADAASLSGPEPQGVSPGSREQEPRGMSQESGVAWLALSRNAESAPRSAGAGERALAERCLRAANAMPLCGGIEARRESTTVVEFRRNSPHCESRRDSPTLGEFRRNSRSRLSEAPSQADAQAWEAALAAWGNAGADWE